MIGVLFTDRAEVMREGVAPREIACRMEVGEALKLRAGDATEAVVHDGRAFLPAGIELALGDKLAFRGREWRVNGLKRREMLGIGYQEASLTWG